MRQGRGGELVLVHRFGVSLLTGVVDRLWAEDEASGPSRVRECITLERPAPGDKFQASEGSTCVPAKARHPPARQVRGRPNADVVIVSKSTMVRCLVASLRSGCYAESILNRVHDVGSVRLRGEVHKKKATRFSIVLPQCSVGYSIPNHQNSDAAIVRVHDGARVVQPRCRVIDGY